MEAAGVDLPDPLAQSAPILCTAGCREEVPPGEQISPAQWSYLFYPWYTVAWAEDVVLDRRPCLGICPVYRTVPMQANDVLEDARKTGFRGVTAIAMDSCIEYAIKVLRELEAAAVAPLVVATSVYSEACRSVTRHGVGVLVDAYDCHVHISCALKWIEGASCRRRLQHATCPWKRFQTANGRRRLQDIRDAGPRNNAMTDDYL